MLYLSIFWLEFYYFHILNQHSQICHTVNFGIESAFSIGPGSAFSEAPGPGPGGLYKVCRMRFSVWSATENASFISLHEEI